MPAGGMTAHHQRLAEPRQFTRRHPHLGDNQVDGNVRAKIVSGDGDADAVRIQPARAMAKGRTVERLPIATMDENDDGRVAVAGKEIDLVAGPGTIADRLRGALLAVGRGIVCPSGHQHRIFRNPRPVIVLDLVVDLRHETYNARRLAAFWADPLALTNPRIKS